MALMPMPPMPGKSRRDSGQAVVEYILLLAIVSSLFMIVQAWIGKFGLGQKILAPVQDTFAKAYRYGHPKGAGYDEGTPKNHPRIYTGGGDNNFRLFINPDAR